MTDDQAAASEIRQEDVVVPETRTVELFVNSLGLVTFRHPATPHDEEQMVGFPVDRLSVVIAKLQQIRAECGAAGPSVADR